MEKIEGWNEWGKYVILELKRLQGCIDKIENSFSQDKKEIYTQLSEIKELIGTRVGNVEKTYSECRLEQEKEITEIKTKVALYAAAIGGGFGIFFTVVFPWLLKII